MLILKVSSFRTISMRLVEIFAVQSAPMLTLYAFSARYDAHVFDTAKPRGTTHRAFSVFLFDEKGRMLLQQRAKSKITFPSVWTNTCCSHPLHGYSPTEVSVLSTCGLVSERFAHCPPWLAGSYLFFLVLRLQRAQRPLSSCNRVCAQVDTPEDVASGLTPGVKRAAVRKLKHELGIEGLDVSQFKFLTRLHYWAADTITHGPSAEWGEHEIDYILFVQVHFSLLFPFFLLTDE